MPLTAGDGPAAADLPSPQDIRLMLTVEGKILPEEALLLYRLASRVQDGCIVEIGSYRGQSTVALALGARSGHQAPVFAIEPHENFTGVQGGQFGPADRVAFCQNLLQAGCLESVRLINLPSQQVAASWNQPIGLLWIDGDHRYESVRRDIEGLGPWVVAGGHVAFHDSQLDPGRVIAEEVAQGNYREVLRFASITVLAPAGREAAGAST